MAARGKRVVYLSEHPALALVEVLANLKGDPRLFPETYQLMKAEVSQDIEIEEIGEEDLAAERRNDLASTRVMGDAWLVRRSSTLLGEPSAPSPNSRNYLLNAGHAEAGTVRIVWCKEMRYDRRLFRV